MTPGEVVEELDAMQSDDPEAAHSDADDLLMLLVGPEVSAAYERLVRRCKWWACA